jgi:hypothetical protein
LAVVRYNLCVTGVASQFHNSFVDLNGKECLLLGGNPSFFQLKRRISSVFLTVVGN